MKVTPKVHEALGASAVPEQVSDTIWKFGGDPGPEVVAPVIVPMLIVNPDVLVAVSKCGDVVVPVFPYTEGPKIIVAGTTLSCEPTI